MSRVSEILKAVHADGAYEAGSDTEERTPMFVEEAEAAINAYIAEIIGEDDKSQFEPEYGYCDTCEFEPTDDTKHCICWYRNQLRAEQRKRAGL